MDTEPFEYHLPSELIAQYPARRRADSRMLVVHRDEGSWVDARFRDLPTFLERGDLIVLNNSRVLPARLFARRRGVRSEAAGTGNLEHLTSRIEVLLVRSLEDRVWEALVRPGRKVRAGERLVFENQRAGHGLAGGKRTGPLEAEVIGRGDFGLRTLRFLGTEPLGPAIEKTGHVPLPPYIRREDEESDRRRYQTVYATQSGSVAAPTAGLHFTRAVLNDLAKRGIEQCEITLHVSLGTFQPLHESDSQLHELHPENYEVTTSAAQAVNRALAEKRRVIAVGTTTARTLEHVASEHGRKLVTRSGETRLFIRPGFQFQVVSGLLTNFHLPGTTLLTLVGAFGGSKLMREAYEHAVRERYRFYSYGDCMLIL